jgi:hypothetical protein
MWPALSQRAPMLWQTHPGPEPLHLSTYMSHISRRRPLRSMTKIGCQANQRYQDRCVDTIGVVDADKKCEPANSMSQVVHAGSWHAVTELRDII